MTVLLLALMLAGAGALVAGWAPGWAGRRQLTKRARALGRGRQAVRQAGPSLMRPGASRLDILAQRFLPRPALLRSRLEATGHRITIGQYGVATLAAMAIFGALAFLLGGSAGFALLAGISNGLVLPHVVVGFLIRRRRGMFLKVFPEAIALTVRGLRAGLPITEAISIIGREISDPVGEEFRTVTDQIRLGMGVEEAMWQAARRVGLPEFDFLVISLSVQRETGGNLAETLENLEDILRRRQQMRLKIRAMSSEATASALIIGSLPFVMAALMSVFSADYLRVLFTEPLGRLMLAGAVTSLAAGSLIMRQMVRFEI